jgi:hypothetical protein
MTDLLKEDLIKATMLNLIKSDDSITTEGLVVNFESSDVAFKALSDLLDDGTVTCDVMFGKFGINYKAH